MSTIKTNKRVDYLPLSDDGPDGSYMKTKMQKTPEGFLVGRSIVTNIGVFSYYKTNADGVVEIVRELRLPEEVFAEESLKTLDNLVCTKEHQAFVTAENAKQLQVGFASKPRADQLYCSSEIMITDADTVSDIVDKGLTAVSCGYTTNLEYKTGVWCGVEYDAIQRDIRYNHLAVAIQEGRAGDAVKMKLDSLTTNSDCMVSIYEKKDNNIKNLGTDRSTKMSKFKIDSFEFDEVDQNLQNVVVAKIDALHKAEAIVKEQKEEIAALQAKADHSALEMEALQQKNEDLVKEDHSAEIEKAAAERAELLVYANKCDIAVNADMHNALIKESIIKAVQPPLAEKIDSITADASKEAYIAASFDLVKGQIDTPQNTLIGDSLAEVPSTALSEKEKTAAARNQMITDEQDMAK